MQVYCNGEEVMTTSGTQSEYTVDIWSGNHPFFQGSNATVMLDEGRVNRFNRRFTGIQPCLAFGYTLQTLYRRCICFPKQHYWLQQSTRLLMLDAKSMLQAYSLFSSLQGWRAI